MATLSQNSYLSKIPVGQPPPGITPDLVSGPSHAYQYFIAAGVCTILMIVLVILRLWVRLIITRTQWWDDVTIVLALGSQLTYTAFAIKACALGLGQHVWDVSVAKALSFYLDAARPSAIMTSPSIYFTKLSLLLLYLRIFEPNRLVKIGIFFGIAFCTIFYIAMLFLFIFIQEPVPLLQLAYALATVGVVSDIYIILLPLLAVSRLHLERSKKVRLFAIFLTGLLAIVMSFIGCVYRFTFDTSDTFETTDFTMSLLPIYIVNTVEVDIGIMCACLPFLVPLFTSFKKERWWTTMYRSVVSRLLASERSSSHRTEPTSDDHLRNEIYEKSNEVDSTKNVYPGDQFNFPHTVRYAHPECQPPPGPYPTNGEVRITTTIWNQTSCV